MSRILIAEDDRVTRAILRQVLEKAGFTVAEAADGKAALEMLGAATYDLLLTDVWMPGLNSGGAGGTGGAGGLELLARLRSDGRAGAMRIVVMTADDTAGTLLEAVSEQAYNYITKPMSPDELLEVVRGALEAPGAVPPIEVISAEPNWVELLVPCEIQTAERIQGFLTRLKADLAPEVRDSIGQAFREMLTNAIEWGGRFDPNRTVRISYIRARKMVLYRIADPGPGFQIEGLAHAAINNPPDQPFEHMRAREEKGLRAGGFGILVAKSTVDELIYNERRNEVVFVKYLE